MVVSRNLYESPLFKQCGDVNASAMSSGDSRYTKNLGPSHIVNDFAYNLANLPIFGIISVRVKYKNK